MVYKVCPDMPIQIIPIQTSLTFQNSTRIHNFALGLLSIPGCATGIALRITLYITSKFYRDQHRALVENILLKKKKITIKLSAFTTLLGKLPKELLEVNFSKFLSVKDLAHIAKTCKEWYGLANPLWTGKAKYLGIAYPTINPQIAVKELFSSIQEKCSKEIILSFGIERLQEFPVISDAPFFKEKVLYEELQKQSILRNADCNFFAFYCRECSQNAGEGILRIYTHYPHPGKKSSAIGFTYNCHLEDNTQFFYLVDPSYLTREQIAAFLKGEVIFLKKKGIQDKDLAFQLKNKISILPFEMSED